MPVKITQAMVLAAGRGTRMRDLTDETPKPLIKVAGKCLIDYVLDKIEAFGVTDVVVNLCYLGGQIENHCLNRKGKLRFTFSREKTALETGGGVKKALPFFKNDAFFVVNSDPLWTEKDVPALTRMAAAFDARTNDALLLLQPRERAFCHDGKGDYLFSDGRPKRKASPADKAPYIYAGAQILTKRLFDGAPDGKFSLNVLYDDAEKKGRLGGIVHDGDWFHVGTPEARLFAEEKLSPSSDF